MGMDSETRERLTLWRELPPVSRGSTLEEGSYLPFTAGLSRELSLRCSLSRLPPTLTVTLAASSPHAKQAGVFGVERHPAETGEGSTLWAQFRHTFSCGSCTCI